MTSILITGKNGQLGREFQAIANNYPDIKFLFTGREELDITSQYQIEKILDENPVDYIINCAGYTQVDKAENDINRAREVNSMALEILGKQANKRGIRVIHISTDYVFSGNHHLPYTEDDKTSPASVYGSSKLEGENMLIRSCRESIIIRTSWLYSPFCSNFVKTMLELGKKNKELRVVFDQVGSPTYSQDLAEVIVHIIKTCNKNDKIVPWGIYHYSNEGVCSWYDLAHEIQVLAQTGCKIIPIESKNYPTIASRPPYSILNKSKIKHIFEVNIPHWRTSLQRSLQRL